MTKRKSNSKIEHVSTLFESGIFDKGGQINHERGQAIVV